MKSETASPPARVLVADDQEYMLEAISSVVNERYEVVGMVRDGVALVKEALRVKPDIALVDISMPGMNGLDATAELKKKNQSSTKIVILTAISEPIILRAAFAAGAICYVLKHRIETDLVTALDAALHERVFISPPLAAQAPAEAIAHRSTLQP